MSPTVHAIYQYPVKGLSHQPLDHADLAEGRGLAGDRRFAIAHGASQFDTRSPRWHPKSQFLTLVRHPKLAALHSEFDEESGTLVLLRNGRKVAKGKITTPLGRDLINQFLAAYMGRDALGVPKIVDGPDIMFTDCEDALISLISRESIKDLERVARRPVDPIRFRGNILLAGSTPWAEFDWVDCDLRIGEARLRVVDRITRCAATEVDPETGERDLNVPRLLQSGFGHVDFGVYASVVSPGRITVGDTVTRL